MPRDKRLDKGRKVRRLARNLVGIPLPSRTIQPANLRKKPKHKRPIAEDVED